MDTEAYAFKLSRISYLVSRISYLVSRISYLVSRIAFNVYRYTAYPESCESIVLGNRCLDCD